MTSVKLLLLSPKGETRLKSLLRMTLKATRVYQRESKKEKRFSLSHNAGTPVLYVAYVQTLTFDTMNEVACMNEDIKTFS